MEVGGSMRYNYRDADVVTVGSSQRFCSQGDSYSNSNKANSNKVTDFNADFRMEWRRFNDQYYFSANVSYDKTRELQLQNQVLLMRTLSICGKSQ